MLSKGNQLGDHVRTFNIKCSTQLGMCMSLDGELLYVADVTAHEVIVLCASNGNRVNSFSHTDKMFSPTIICLSRDGKLLFVADISNNCIHVLHALDGSYVRTIGKEGIENGEFRLPRGLCVSLDNEYLFVADCSNHRVQVMRISDGAYVRTISHGRMKAFTLCLSHDGKLLFVTCFNISSACVKIFQVADGKYVRTIGSKGSKVGQFIQPRDLCISPNGELLFVADIGNSRIQVFHTSDDRHIHTINIACMNICLTPNGAYFFVNNYHKSVTVFCAAYTPPYVGLENLI